MLRALYQPEHRLLVRSLAEEDGTVWANLEKVQLELSNTEEQRSRSEVHIRIEANEALVTVLE